LRAAVPVEDFAVAGFEAFARVEVDFLADEARLAVERFAGAFFARVAVDRLVELAAAGVPSSVHLPDMTR